MKKNKRGTFEYATTTDKKVVVTRWMDNSVVTVASTAHGVYPLMLMLAVILQPKKRKF